MSVLSRAAAPPATHEVAAAVAALLKSFDPNAPSRLAIPETPESRGALDDPRLGESDAAEAHLPPKRLLGPMGLGSASLLVNLPTSGTIAGVADQAAHPVTPAGGVVPALRPTPPTPGVGQPLRPIPRANSSGRVPTPPTTPRAAPKSAGPGTPSGSGRIPRGPSGLGALSAARRAAISGAAVGATPATAAAASPPATPAVAPPATASSAVSGAPAVPHAPNGIGTASVRRTRQAGQAIPPLYCPPPVRDNPELGEAVNVGILSWAKEIGLYEGRLDELRKADFGRLIMLAHPDCDDADRLLAAAKCAVSEWSVDDYYCEEDASDIAPDGSHSNAAAELGPRLELAAAAMDPVHLPVRYQAEVEAAMQSDPILRAFRTSFEHLSRFASPTQVARLRTEIAGWFIALGAEAGWRGAKRMPPVWEYLLNRQPHSFLPCMAPIDAVGGYELPAAEYTDPRVRRVVTTAALASQMVNDLYSMAREDLSGGREFNLPTVLAAEENCSRADAVQRTAEVHDELVHRFEAEAGALAASGSPELRRFLGGLWAWMGGNRAWHAGSRRYNETS
ncbi:family 2 encapsulin nanocompartment cargo protein terpene cyclase [Nocardia sp. NBC_01503]|uniref:family 2 encapsulin nanocompartment cargo protein terpene cyclase n=1 Tax=Nocardia sp. NBC_01503 TaxID=2975997 RepID=UPI002E7B7C7E|nr:family 2 encapsulin nanocompartment cargo protein terpene cyclase [Nocardia sp. NBC_01503]WTL32270.1 family 2 encapsulin nanocompartment cargo protein terpene cyclase [Nocardia sp. NBC_01503]